MRVRHLPLAGATMMTMALGLANYWLLTHPPETAHIAPEGDVSEQIEAEDDVSDIVRQVQLLHSKSRPLFLETRRPWTPPPPPPESAIDVPIEQLPEPLPLPPEETASLSVTLIGVQQDPGAIRALVTKAGGDAVWVRQGEVVDGWTVERISADAIDFAADGLSQTFQLYPATPEGLAP